MADYAERVGAALADAAGRDGTGVWRLLGAAGLLADLYPPPSRPDRGPRPVVERLRALLAGLDRRCDLGVGLCTCAQVAAAVPILAHGRRGAVIHAAWQEALSGRAVTALGGTDAGAAGSDLVNLTTTVRIENDKLTLDGGKRWVTAATYADQFLILARHRPGTHVTAFTWVLVPAMTPGVLVEPADTPFFHGSGVGHVSLRDVRLDADHVVGRVGGGLAAFAHEIATERLAAALTATALTRRVLADTHRYLLARRIGGRSLWEDDSVRQRFARWVVRHRELEALTARLAPAFDTSSALTEAMVLKASAAQVVEEIVGGCAQLHGADGFRAGGIQWLRAEAALFGIGGGVTEVMLAGVADHAEVLLADPT